MTNRLTRQFRGPGGAVELLGIAFPLVVSQACETAMMFTDRLFLSRLGPEYMSAAMSGGLTAFMFMTFFFGLTGYANALVAQHLGAGRPRDCALAVTQALLLSVMAYPLVLACIPIGHWLFSIVGLAPEQQVPQRTYFDILLAGAAIPLLRNCFSAFFSGVGRTRVIMLAAGVSMVVNIAANWMLIFGRLGLPAMGIRGAAIGTLLGGAAGLFVIVAAYVSRSNRKTWNVAAGTRFDRRMMATLIRFGYPSGLEFFLNLLAFDLLVMTFHSYGLTVASAVTIAFNWDFVSFVPLIGVNIGVTSLVGRYMGARDPDTAQRTTISGIMLVSLYAVLLVVLCGCFPAQLVGVFRPSGPDPAFAAAAPLAVFMVRLVSVYVFADAVGLVFSGALRGAGDTFVTMCLSVASHWVLTGTCLVMVKVVKASPRVTWSWLVVLIWGIGGAFVIRYRSGRWRNIRVVQPGQRDTPPATC